MRLVATAALALLQLASCSQAAPAGVQLATDQTLRAVINSEPSPGGLSLDPAHVSFSVPTAIDDNVFDGLYRYDSQMREVPDLAEGMPVVSADGLTYTFHLHQNIRFWTGAPVTAEDVLYSWNRAASIQGDWAFAFQAVIGYAPVAAGQATTMAGLSVPDRYTVVARLSQRTGYWLSELTLPSAWIVSRSSIAAGGEQWWKDPNHLVGTGPFRMNDWVPNSELDFESVPNWWGGSTGALKRIELHVEADRGARWQGYLDGRYDLLGYGRGDLALKDHAQLSSTLQQEPGLRAQVRTWPADSSFWLGFNLQSGPFAGFGDGAMLRRAFAQAIDRKKLAAAACDGGLVCVAATGGLIAKGLAGYLGDGADPTAKFDPVAARATVKRLDPDGTLLKGLVFYYPVVANFDPTQAMAQALRSQWLMNLGVDVTIRGLDQSAYYPDVFAGRFTMWRGGWQADYDHPQDWFDNNFVFNGNCEQGLCINSGAIYDRAGYAASITIADEQPLSESLPEYRKAGQQLVDDAALSSLYYSVRTAIVKPYVQGYGANAMFDYRWTSISILQH